MKVAELWLNTRGLDPTQAEHWTDFLNFACRSLGASTDIRIHESDIPDEPRDFAVVSASAALTRKLLLSVPRVYVEPTDGPASLDPFFYGLGRAAGKAWAVSPAQPTTALISSVFNGDAFLPGFLANSAALEGYRELEHFLIRAGSPGAEHAALLAHVRAHPGAVYLNLSRDPGLYAVWNFGARLSNARFLSNANIDDRRAPAQVQRLASRLQAQPELAAVSTALRVSTTRNRDWSESGTADLVMFGDLPEQVYGATGLFKRVEGRWVSRNLPHCMPLWRRFLHVQLGGFDEKRYGPSADWEFWLRAGRAGAQYHFDPEPLGLYLRDEASYWRRDAGNRRFDTQIAEEYSDLVAADARPRSIRARPLGLALPGVLEQLKSGALLEAIGQWVVTLTTAERTSTAVALLEKMLRPYLGQMDWYAWAGRHAALGAVSVPNHWTLARAAAINAVVDLVEAYDAEALGEHAPRVRRFLSLACLDLQACLGDEVGWLAWAALARRAGDVDLENTLLASVHDPSPRVFWERLQTGYRFAVTPAEVEGKLAAGKHAVGKPSTLNSNQPLAANRTGIRLWYYPHYTKNAYLRLLYAPLVASGGTVAGTSDLNELLQMRPATGKENILHVHWLNLLFRQTEGDEQTVSDRLRVLLQGLAAQQAAGFKLYWTVHNALSHESSFPELERRFRQALYAQADRVFVHHPLAAELLEWLPDRTRIRLAEHGPYPVAPPQGEDRQRARQTLGFGADDWVLTSIGQVRNYKGLMTYLPVLRDLLVQHARLRIVIAGVIQSPQVKAWLGANTHPRLNVRDGFLSDQELDTLMQASNAGLLTYDRTLTSGALFHWLSAGRPVLAPNLGTIPAYVVDGWNGWCYDNADDLRARLAYAMLAPAEEESGLANNARKTAGTLQWGMWEGG